VTGVPAFSVIIPVSGRSSLDRTLRRLGREDRGDIEVIVVSDGPQSVSQAIAQRHAETWPRVRYIEGPATRSWGNAQRMEGVRLALGTYLIFIDDDDVHRRGTFNHIRGVVQKSPNRIVIFRMRRFDGVIWRKPCLVLGEVSTQQFLVPNIPGKVGSWLRRDRYASDYDFIEECVALQGEPLWDETVIAVLEPLRLRSPMAWLRPRLGHLRYLAIRKARKGGSPLGENNP
jgi:glycosyltransferase involved in cell wall biosynthesis